MRLRHIAAVIATMAIVGTFIQRSSEDEGRQIDFVPQPTVMTVTATTVVDITQRNP